MQPDIDKMDLHQLRTRRDEIQADLRAIRARIVELEMIGLGLADAEIAPSKPLVEAESGPPPGPNAHPEGEDSP